LPMINLKKWEPIHKVADNKDQEGPFKNL